MRTNCLWSKPGSGGKGWKSVLAWKRDSTQILRVLSRILSRSAFAANLHANCSLARFSSACKVSKEIWDWNTYLVWFILCDTIKWGSTECFGVEAIVPGNYREWPTGFPHYSTISPSFSSISIAYGVKCYLLRVCDVTFFSKIDLRSKRGNHGKPGTIAIVPGYYRTRRLTSQLKVDERSYGICFFFSERNSMLLWISLEKVIKLYGNA